jgi:hypothetical protein
VPNWTFLIQTANFISVHKTYMVSALLRAALIGVNFSLAACIKRLFYGFSLFPGATRCSKSPKENRVNTPAVHRKSQFSMFTRVSVVSVASCPTMLQLRMKYYGFNLRGDVGKISWTTPP